jgi:hypothetical protein
MFGWQYGPKIVKDTFDLDPYRHLFDTIMQSRVRNANSDHATCAMTSRARRRH